MLRYVGVVCVVLASLAFITWADDSLVKEMELEIRIQELSKERLHGTLLDEHFRVLGRTKFYESIQEMQTDLDAYLVTYKTAPSGPRHERQDPRQHLRPLPAENQEI